MRFHHYMGLSLGIVAVPDNHIAAVQSSVDITDLHPAGGRHIPGRVRADIEFGMNLRLRVDHGRVPFRPLKVQYRFEDLVVDFNPGERRFGHFFRNRGHRRHFVTAVPDVFIENKFIIRRRFGISLARPGQNITGQIPVGQHTGHPRQLTGFDGLNPGYFGKGMRASQYLHY